MLTEESGSVKKKVKAIIRQYCNPQIVQFLDVPLENLPQEMKNELNPGGQETAMFASVRSNPNENKFIDFLKVNLYDQLGTRYKKGPWEYLLGAARILCADLKFYSFDNSMRGGAIVKFSKLIRLIHNHPNFFLGGAELNQDLNGMNYEQFMSMFEDKMKMFIKKQREESSSFPVIEDHGYKIERVTDEVVPNRGAIPRGRGATLLNKLDNYTDWCICGELQSFEYPQYTGGGGAVYIMQKRGFENIPKEPTEGCPLDDYGLSLICVIVGPDGLPDNITTRWNHENNGENPEGLLTATDLQRVTGVRYFEVFKPRTEEELRRLNMVEENTNKPSAMDQVHNKVNAGVMDAVTGCGTMEEGAEPESDEYSIGGEGGNNDYFHALNEEKKTKDESIKKYFKPLAEFMKGEGLNVAPFPEVKLNWDEQDGLFIKTGYYEPESKTITIFCADRHPKDILRTFAHEMIHHSQNLDGIDLNFSSKDDVKDNEKLEEVESEAYLKGNVMFRKWTEHEQSGKEALQEGVKHDIVDDIISEATDPDDIDLSSFNIKTALNPKFWKDERLDSRIRMKLLDIADDFVDFLGVDWVKPEDIIITGSLANFNWNKKFSDIDLHVLMDFSKVDSRTDFVKEYFDSKKSLWNESHKDLSICGFPVEVYVQDSKEKHSSTGVYSLDKDEWITEPKREKLKSAKVNKNLIRKKVAQYIDIIKELEQNYKDADGDYEMEKVMEKADKVFDDIKGERRSGLDSSDNEISNGNIIFKCLRRLGYIEKIFDIKGESYDKLNSISESKKKLLKEDQEGDSMKKARRYLVQHHGFKEEDANETVRIKVRQEFGELHHNERAGKFIFGLTRILFDENISHHTKARLNSIIKFITQDEQLYNSFDKNLNGLSAIELVTKFRDMLNKLRTEKEAEQESKKEVRSGNYRIVRIDSFEESSKYSKYTDFENSNGHWCLTYNESMYNSYTENGIDQIYFCLRDGFENLTPQPGKNCPLDDYGLSMLCVIVNPNGLLKSCTCRWNHLHGGGDEVMGKEQIEEVVGGNFEELFIPNPDDEKELFSSIDKFSRGESVYRAFEDAKSANFTTSDGEHVYIVRHKNKQNIIYKNKLLFDGWFDGVDDASGERSYGFNCLIVYRNDKFNIIKPDLKFLFRSWVDYIGMPEDGFMQLIIRNKEYNYIKPDLTLLLSENFTWAGSFDPTTHFAPIGKGDWPNNKMNLINHNGEPISDLWFDDVNSFHDYKNLSYAVVKLNGVKNCIGKDGKLLFNEWHRDIGTYRYGNMLVEDVDDVGGIYIRVFNPERGVWFNYKDGQGNVIDKFIDVQITGNPNILKIRFGRYGENMIILDANGEGRLLFDENVSSVTGFRVNGFMDDYALVWLTNGKSNILNFDGELISDEWFNYVHAIHPSNAQMAAFVVAISDKGENILKGDGTYVFNGWHRFAGVTNNRGIYYIVKTYKVDEYQSKALYAYARLDGKYILPFYVSSLVSGASSSQPTFDLFGNYYYYDIPTNSIHVMRGTEAWSVDEFIKKYPKIALDYPEETTENH